MGIQAAVQLIQPGVHHDDDELAVSRVRRTPVTCKVEVQPPRWLLRRCQVEDICEGIIDFVQDRFRGCWWLLADNQFDLGVWHAARPDEPLAHRNRVFDGTFQWAQERVVSDPDHDRVVVDRHYKVPRRVAKMAWRGLQCSTRVSSGRRVELRCHCASGLCARHNRATGRFRSPAGAGFDQPCWAYLEGCGWLLLG
jgi:hypothetical protein